MMAVPPSAQHEVNMDRRHEVRPIEMAHSNVGAGKVHAFLAAKFYPIRHLRVGLCPGRQLSIPNQMKAIDSNNLAAEICGGNFGIKTKGRQAGEYFLIEDLQLKSRQMRSEAAMRAGIEGHVSVIFAIELVFLRVREGCRIEVSARRV